MLGFILLFRENRMLRHPAVIAVLVALLLLLLLGWYWSDEPDFVRPVSSLEQPAVVGVATTSMLLKTIETLLDKPGGYISNDVAPPGVWIDNIANWEFGVLQQVRDLAKVLRNDYSRSQTQSVANVHLEIAEPKLNVDSDAWLFPSAEGEYQEGADALTQYLESLQDPATQDAQFYARADNLNEWLSQVEKRLGSLSQRLSQARPQVRVNTDLAGDANAQQSTATDAVVLSKTPWLQIDDNFYEARGTAWALLHYLKAVELDFAPVLEDKNALPSVRQIIQELQSTQQPVRSFMILNGSGMGMLANHSLVMSSYIGRANSAIADLRRLLADG